MCEELSEEEYKDQIRRLEHEINILRERLAQVSYRLFDRH